MIKAVGAAVTLNFRELFDIRYGKIALSVVTYDVHEFIRQLKLS